MPASYMQEVREIARKTGHSEQEVEGLYLEMLGALSCRAQIKDYLFVLTSKRVCDCLREAERQDGDSSPRH